ESSKRRRQTCRCSRSHRKRRIIMNHSVPLTKPPSRIIRLLSWLARRGILPTVLAVVCFVLAPLARAIDPPPGGGYPGGNTANGFDALTFNTTGFDNTAIGSGALAFNTPATKTRLSVPAHSTSAPPAATT